MCLQKKTKEKEKHVSRHLMWNFYPVILVTATLLNHPLRQCKPVRTSDPVLVARCVEENWNLRRQIIITTWTRARASNQPPPPQPTTGSSSSLPGLYKRVHSPFREHGGSSTSQVSNRTAHQAEEAVLTQSSDFQMLCIFDVFIGWVIDYNYIIFLS